MTDRHPIWNLLDKLEMDAGDIKKRVQTLRMEFAALNLDEAPQATRHRCPSCPVTFRSPPQLAEHVYNSHNGPVPEHYLAAERLAGLEAA